MAENDIEDAVRELAARPFDVTSDPPIRLTLISPTGTEDPVLVVVLHHIAADGVSLGPLRRDLLQAYAARSSGSAPDWDPLPVQYADYTRWIRAELGDESDPDSLVAQQVRYWTATLAGAPEESTLPVDRPRPAVPTYRGASAPFDIDRELHARIVGLAARTDATVFMVLHSALAVLLARTGASDDVVIGTPIAGRGDAALDDLIGMFVNTLALRTEVDPESTFRALLARVRGTDLDAFAHSDVPFEQVVDALAPSRVPARHPIFQTILSLTPFTPDDLDTDGVTVVDGSTGHAKFDLQVTVTERRGGGLDGEVTVGLDVFDAATAHTVAERFVRLLDAATTAPDAVVSRLPLLSDAERTELVPVRGRPSVPAQSLAAILEAAASAHPDSVALEFEDRRVSYRALHESANRLARMLIARGVGPEDTVAVAVARSVESVLAVWAVALAGGAFVPVDPQYPRDRRAFMLADSAARRGITVVEHASDLPDSVDWIVLDDPAVRDELASVSSAPITDTDRVRTLLPGHPAYVVYTSGSTGTPKGVVVGHDGLANFTDEQRRRYSLTERSRTLHYSSPSFDASVLELLLAVAASSTMVIAPPTVYGGRDLTRLLVNGRVTHAFVTPAALATADATAVTALEHLVVGGEAWGAELAREWAPGRSMHNGYGPTEASMMVTIGDPVDDPASPVDLGSPVIGSRAVVLDSRLQPVPVGAVGELYVGGPGTARGYHRRFALTAARFVADPYGEPGRRLYRTGDVVRWIRDRRGRPVLEYLGRSDFQVKVRGFRVELGEIDAVLGAHPSVRFAVTVGHETPSRTAVLVSYVVPADGAVIDTAALTAHCAARLASHMVPAAVMVLGVVPLTPVGKLDRAALPEPVFTAAAEFAAPRTSTEIAVASVMGHVLGVDRIGVADSFFDLGGNSLSATRVVARLAETLGVDVPVRAVFESPTVGALATVIDASDRGAEVSTVRARTRPERIPLSLAQRRMWFLDRFDPGSAAYNVPVVIRLDGALDTGALADALADVLARHESLRTVYPNTDTGPVQRILDTAGVALSRVSVSGDLESAVADVVGRGFDVTSEVPVRAVLLEESETEHVLTIVVHHIATDGWSMGPLARDLMVAYAARSAGAAPQWSPLPVQYADYALWQRDLLGTADAPTDRLRGATHYWVERLRGRADLLELPTDRARPAVASGRTDRVVRGIDAGTHAALDAVARRTDSSLFMVVHTALSILLARVCGTSDIIVGTPVAGRGRSELDDVVGMFVNTVVLRTAVDLTDTIESTLRRVRAADLDAFGAAEVPFEHLVQELDPVRTASYQPIYQVEFAFQNNEMPELVLGDLEISGIETSGAPSANDLSVVLTDHRDGDGSAAGLTLFVDYACDLFDRSTADRLADALLCVLDAVAADPSRTIGGIDVLSRRDASRIRSWRESYAPGGLGGRSLLDRFRDRVAIAPLDVAVRSDDLDVTYAELAQRIVALARELTRRGIGPDQLVGVSARRSVEMIVAAYAVIECGAAYVPLDPDHPADRVATVLRTAAIHTVVCGDAAAADAVRAAADVDVVLSTAGRRSERVEWLSDAERGAVVRTDNLAYVLHTSGSTGTPKGVAISHGAIVNHLEWLIENAELGPDDRVIQLAPFTFDVSVWELFAVLGTGGTLIVLRDGGHREFDYLARVMAMNAATVGEFVPSVLTELALTFPESLASYRRIFVGGEAYSAALASALESVAFPLDRLDNSYGPTEAAVTTVVHRLSTGEVDPPIGSPVAGTAVEVLDASLRRVAPGVRGELYLQGPQLARGYVGRPALTAERFVAADGGARMYRTGDLTRWTGTGELHYVGRIDTQVKIRGVRIELGEIETVLVADATVAAAAAVVLDGARIVACVVPAAGTTVEVATLIRAAAQSLPRYMVPDALVIVDEMPVDANGKVDRRALAALSATTTDGSVAMDPVGDTERVVADVMADVLGVAYIGRADDFFRRGGNSMLAVRVVVRVGEALGRTVPVRALFDAATVRGLAAVLDSADDASTRAPVRLVRGLGSGATGHGIPLSPAQGRMWFLNQFDPTATAYNVPLVVTVSGALDLTALRAALRDVVDRHHVLRTVYPNTADGPVQRVLATADAGVDLVHRVVDRTAVESTVAEVVSTRFDVASAVPVAAVVVTSATSDGAGSSDHVLALVIHHVSTDGVSVETLLRDLVTAYLARASASLPTWHPLPVQYADFAVWHRAMLGSDEDPNSVAAQQKRFWSSALDGLPGRLPLPTDRPHPPLPSYRGAAVGLDVDADLHARVLGLVDDTGSTVFMVLHAVFAAVLSRVAASDDVAIGTAVAGRGHRDVTDLVGMFVNTLVLRTAVDQSGSWTDLIAAVRASDLAAFDHADVPFEDIVDRLDPDRTPAYHPLFQIALDVETRDHTDASTITVPGLTVTPTVLDTSIAKFDLQLSVVDRRDADGAAAGLRFDITYATDLFDGATVERVVQHLVRALDAAVTDPGSSIGDVDLVTDAERRDLVPARGPAPGAASTLADLLADSGHRFGPEIALVSDTEELTYDKLAGRANQLARVLVDRGVGPETVVALALPRSVDSVIATWAVAATGAAFVPVDPGYPRERIEHMVRDSGAVVGLTLDALAPALSRALSWVSVDAPDVRRRCDAESRSPLTDDDRMQPAVVDNVAYVVYTSGSTGRPKGVAVTHAGVADLVRHQRLSFATDEFSRVLHAASPSFDASVFELLLAAGAGARLVLSPADVLGGDESAEVLRTHEVTHAVMTPSVLASLRGSEIPSLRVIATAGEACPPELREHFSRGRSMLDLYGPTECTVWVTASADGGTGIGRPITGTSVVLLDARLRPVPVGVRGELYVGGAGLARGYVRQSGLTAARFVADPHGSGERLYRTGDLAAWTAGGDLEFLGRSDTQVKVRGVRIELGEIDAVLGAHPDVSFAATVAHTDPSGRTTLASYVTTSGAGGAELSAALSAHLTERLPSPLVPSSVVVLDEVPLTPVGKLDRSALPAPTVGTAADDYAEPVGAREIALAQLFGDVTGAPRVGRDDNFFALGGNSLSAMQVTGRVGQLYSIRVPVRTLFEAPTPRELALALSAPGDAAVAPLVAMARPERIPLSLQQQRLWFLNRFDPASPGDNLPLVIRLTGTLDVEALRRATADVIGRHESLRTVYPDSADGPHQVVLAEGPELQVCTVGESAALTVAALLANGFDVTAAVPLRATLVRCDVDDHVLVLVLHHIGGDGWSLGPLARDVMVAYAARLAGQEPSWSPLPVQYADYSVWQHAVLGAEDQRDSILAREIAYWTEHLAGAPDRLDLPTDRPRPPVQSLRGETVAFTVDRELADGVQRVAADSGASVFMVVHAVFALVLGRLSGQADVVVGAPIAGRGEEALDDVVGMFAGTVALRTPLVADEPFVDFLARVLTVDIDAFDHANVPFERIVAALDPVRSMARHPVFQVALSFQNLHAQSFELPGLTIAPFDAETTTAAFDLHLVVEESPEQGMSLVLNYATDLFDRSGATNVVERFRTALRSVVRDPGTAVGDVSLLTDTALAELRDAETGERVPVAPETIVWSTIEHAARTPDAIALEHGDVRVTYAEFDDRTDRLARALRSRGVEPETVVGVCLPRGIDLVAMLFAVMRAGGAYVPLDPDHPTDRAAHVIDASSMALLVAPAEIGAHHAAAVPAVTVDDLESAEPRSDPAVDVYPESLAYVIFTSGSTGRPKGVAVSHAAMVTQLSWKRAQYAIDPHDAVLLHTAATFDLSVWQLWSALSSGARTVLADNDTQRDAAALLTTMADGAVTVLHAVPTTLAMLDAYVGETPEVRYPSSLRRILCIGEALPGALAASVREHAGVPVDNLYGPTEATVSVTVHATSDADIASTPIGVPVWNTTVRVLDSRLHRVPDGVIGELYLGGDQLARGYVGRSALTAAHFVADPDGDGRIYRTGDLVRWTVRDGRRVLDHVGRADFQVKISGMRIELGEIESVLRGADGVDDAVVVASGDRLAAYVSGHVDGDAVHHHVRDRVPGYLVPATVTVLESLPLGTTGKIDRAALPTPVPLAVSAEFVAPSTPTERLVASVIGELVSPRDAARTGIGALDDFFDLGGNSLLATRVVARLSAAIGADVPVRAVFEAPTVRALAAWIDTVPDGAHVPIVVGPRPDRLPLSSAQQRMWILARLTPHSSIDNIPLAVRLTGDLDTDAFAAAVLDVLHRHESLRTRYPDVDGEAVQVIEPPETTLPDLAPVPLAGDLDAAIALFVARPFDVTQAPPVRARLLRLVDGDHVFVLVVHHISADGFSLGPVARDLVLAYAARRSGSAPGWDPLPVQYADYALWQRDRLGDEDDPNSVRSRQGRYWASVLAGAPDELTLPFDRPRPLVSSYASGSVAFAIDQNTRAAMRALARGAGATEFMILHAALAILLSRLSGSTDVSIGTPTAGRGDAALDGVVGMFVGTVVLRTRIEPQMSVADVIDHVRARDVDAFDHADLPFEKVVELLNPPRSRARHPLFQVMLALQNLGETSAELPGLTVTGLDGGELPAKYDLQFTVVERRGPSGEFDGYDGTLTFAAELFDASTAESLARRFEAAVRAVVRGDHGELVLESERAELSRHNDTGRWVPPVTVVDLVRRRAQLDPGSTAVVCGDTRLTYAQFDARAAAVAGGLFARGVQPESTVAVALPRSIEMLVAVHAVLRAGAAYVPIDPSHPADRIQHVLDSASPALILGSRRFPTGLAGAVDIEDLENADSVPDPWFVRPHGLAYVLFTSGSTGRPKGVAITHEALTNRVLWMQDEYSLTPADVVLQKTPITFDVSVWELFWPLVVGTTLVLASPDGHRDPEYLASVIDRERVSVVHFVPSVLGAFADRLGGDRCSSLRHIFASGEALPAAMARRVRRSLPGVRVHNLYGPTEATVDVTRHEVLGADEVAVPIGTPVWNTGLHVLDARLRDVPVGVPGELYLSGIQLARGYVDQPDVTAARFVAMPGSAAGRRMYRTGDVVRRLRGGEIEYLGRNDFQVKVRGLRIELGEIDAAMLAHAEVRRGVTLAVGDGERGRLVAYYVGGVAEDALRDHLSTRLPEFMIPVPVRLDEFPVTENGKLDRNALPTAAVRRRAPVAAETDTERVLVAILEEVLDADTVGVEDDYFGIGGTSLVAIRVVALVRDRLALELPLAAFFRTPTVRGLARVLDERAAPSGASDAALAVVLPIRTTGSRTPMFAVHPSLGVAWSYTGLASYLPDTPIHGLQWPGLTEDGDVAASVAELAARYVDEVEVVAPTGPVRLLGWSLGGVVAHAMTAELADRGRTVESLVMLDSYAIPDTGTERAVTVADLLAGTGERVSAEGALPSAVLDLDLADLGTVGADDLVDVIAAAVPGTDRATVRRWVQGIDRQIELWMSHTPRPVDTRLVYLAAGQDDPTGTHGVSQWTEYVTGHIDSYSIDTSHWAMASVESWKIVGSVMDDARVGREKDAGNT